MRNISTLLLVLIFACTSVQAKVVKGKVTSGKEKLSGVIVTDGKNFTKTSKKGTFKLNIEDDAKFVFIVTPSGYAADWSSGVPQFYQKAQDKDFFEFDLVDLGKDESTYHIIAVGDPQPRSEKHCEIFAEEPLEDLCNTVASLEHLTVGVVAGDLSFDVFPLLDNWKRDIVRTGIPFYTVPGNHDHDKQISDDDRAAIAHYNEQFGPENYAFQIGNDYVFMLDNIIYNSYRTYEEGYTEEVLTWVKNMMNFIPESSDIYIVQHSPLDGKHHAGRSINDMEMLEILGDHHVTFISGHNHTHRNLEFTPKVMDHNIGAICGTWWDTYHSTDGTPRGFKLFTKSENGLEWYYKAIGKDRDYQYQIYGLGETLLHPDCIVANVWDVDSAWKIEWYEDGKYMGAMEPVGEYSPVHTAELDEAYSKTGKTPANYRRTKVDDKQFFAAKPSADAQVVTIVITDRFGHTWKEEIPCK